MIKLRTGVLVGVAIVVSLIASGYMPLVDDGAEISQLKPLQELHEKAVIECSEFFEVEGEHIVIVDQNGSVLMRFPKKEGKFHFYRCVKMRRSTLIKNYIKQYKPRIVHDNGDSYEGRTND